MYDRCCIGYTRPLGSFREVHPQRDFGEVHVCSLYTKEWSDETRDGKLVASTFISLRSGGLSTECT
jgi:hypothetical protein